MPVTIVIGAQWGDEGKGRFVDYFSADSEMVARYAGGDNAGHTVAVKGEVFKMHLIPSGILHDGVVAIMGNGMVINPISLLREMNRLREQGISISPENLVISSRAHIITPAHIEADRGKEAERGEDKIGTTLRGIGPAYLDKIGRRGLRMGLMLDVEDFAESMEIALNRYNNEVASSGFQPVDVKDSIQAYIDAANELQPYIKETTVYLHERLKAGDRIVCEGAQGTLLDVDHGSYPFVTSSSPTAGGVMTGLGIGPTHVDRVVGVAKAFSTRVGGGPMPTEEEGAVAQRLRGTGDNYWDEFGTTTGRPRRCGWLDTVLLRYSAMVNGLTELMLTKMDILSGFDELKVAVAYEVDGVRYDVPPSTIKELARAVPIYETMAGWQEDISAAQTLEDLPKAAVDYIKRVEELCGVPIKVVSVGPERHQVVNL
ncbi:MAG: adenylosuccinate synthase [Phototrophicaceae bacterium]